MFNQLQQFPGLEDKNSSRAQFGMLNCGIRVRDPSQMFVFGDANWVRGVSTENRSQQAGIFGKSLVGNQCSGSVDHNLCNKDDSRSLGTKGFNLFAKKENFGCFHSISTHDSAGLLTKNRSQQVGIFGKSLVRNECSGSVDRNSCKKDDSKSLGTKGSNGFRSIPNGSGSVMKSAVVEVSSNDENPSRISQQKGHFSKPSQSPKSGNDQVTNQNHMAWHIVKGDGQMRSTRPANTRLDAPVQQKSSASGSCELPSTSDAAKMVKDGQQKPSVNLQQLDVANQNTCSLKPKKEKNTVSQDKCSLKPKKEIFTVSKDTCTLKSKKREVSVNQDTCSLKSKKRKSSANQNTCSLKSKKRKLSILERLPWHKEETKRPSRLYDISASELKWARSVGRLPEKLKELAEETRDSRWIINRKRRLGLTTKLMQLIFQPPPAIVLSEDALKHCDVVTYYASKLALDDACRLCLLEGKKVASKSSGEHDLLEVIEGFVYRSKRLEENVSRLEKSGSLILQVKMDLLDLERFSFTNRFAKLHTTRPTFTGDTRSSTTRKPYPEVYMKTHPMPKTVPEGQKCLFL